MGRTTIKESLANQLGRHWPSVWGFFTDPGGGQVVGQTTPVYMSLLPHSLGGIAF